MYRSLIADKYAINKYNRIEMTVVGEGKATKEHDEWSEWSGEEKYSGDEQEKSD